MTTRKYSSLFFLAMLFFSQCGPKHIHGLAEKWGKASYGKIAYYDQHGNYHAMPLDPSQLEEFKKLEFDNWGPKDLIKKCLFEPNIRFVLHNPNPKDSIVVDFSASCKMWRIVSRNKTSHGNYDTGSEALEIFLQQFLVPSKEPGLKENLEPLEHQKKDKKNATDNLTTVAVFLPGPGQILGRHSLEDSTQTRKILTPLQSEYLKNIMLDSSLYETGQKRILCGEPMTAIFRWVAPPNDVISTVFVYETCEQVIFENGEKTYAIVCPRLLSKIDSFLQIK